MPTTWSDPLVRPRQWKRNMKLGTWNVISLHSSGLLKTVVRELGKYKLDLVGVHEVKWDKGDTVRAGEQIFSMENETEINWEQNFSYTTE